MWDTIGLLALLSIPFFIAVDLVQPQRSFDTPSGWRVRALVVSVLTFGLSMAITMGWGYLLADVHLIDGSGLGILGGAAVGILLYELIHYWYHRTAHRSDLLWRWAHQMHHSAESLETLGAYYLHPADTFFFTTWSALVFFPVLGLRPEAGVVAGAFLTFNAVFQHANIKTPRWLGYVIQRPESHGIHHERGVHAYNYSDLPLWDMVFGTFNNPRVWDAEAGFYKGASSRVGAMLMGRDVSSPTTAEHPAADTGDRWAGLERSA